MNAGLILQASSTKSNNCSLYEQFKLSKIIIHHYLQLLGLLPEVSAHDLFPISIGTQFNKINKTCLSTNMSSDDYKEIFKNFGKVPCGHIVKKSFRLTNESTVSFS